MAKEGSIIKDNDVQQAIVPSVKFWTTRDFDQYNKEMQKGERQITFYGTGAIVLGAGLMYIASGKPSLQLVSNIGLVLLLIGLFFVIGRRVNAFATASVTPSVKGTSNYKPWQREVICTYCHEKVSISIGLFEHNCTHCGKSDTRLYGTGLMLVDQTEVLMREMKKGIKCRNCKTLYFPLELPAQFICPNCQKTVYLERIPI